MSDIQPGRLAEMLDGLTTNQHYLMKTVGDFLKNVVELRKQTATVEKKVDNIEANLVKMAEAIVSLSSSIEEMTASFGEFLPILERLLISKETLDAHNPDEVETDAT